MPEKPLDEERSKKQQIAESNRNEKAVEVAGLVGRVQNPDQKFKLPTIVRSKRQSVRDCSFRHIFGR